MPPRFLANLAEALTVPVPSANPQLYGITHSSQDVVPGDLYVALPGSKAHGADFVEDAIGRGAVAVLTDPSGYAQAAGTGRPVLVVDAPRVVLGRIAAWVYGDPTADLEVFGVTGTNGKTTITYLLEGALRALGRRTGLTGTVETRIGEETLPSTRTTPEATDLQAMFAVMRERGVNAVAMEVSSHALEYGRVSDVQFLVGGFTNLTQDHLDFHGDMERYFAAKARLFDGRCRYDVVNIDDSWGRRLVSPGTVTVSAHGEQSAHWRAGHVVPEKSGGQRFTVSGPGDLTISCEIQLPGTYNVANALLTIAMLATAGFDPAIVADSLSRTVVPGRTEPILLGQPFRAFVDYAHTPDAVTALLRAVRPMTTGRLIVVVGCGGDRDRDKRPRMGAAAASGADLAIITDDNPRSEDPATIRAAALAGALGIPASQRGEVIEISGRYAAIKLAVQRARPGDTVVVAGKGHEQGQEVAGVVHPFDDRVVLRRSIESVLL